MSSPASQHTRLAVAASQSAGHQVCLEPGIQSFAASCLSVGSPIERAIDCLTAEVAAVEWLEAIPWLVCSVH